MARRAVALLLLLVASAARAAVIDEAGLFRVSTNDSPPEINRAQLTLLKQTELSLFSWKKTYLSWALHLYTVG